MRCLPLFIGTLLLSVASQMLASPVDDLASPNQIVRDKAAAEMRTTYHEIPESKWQWVLDLEKTGRTKQSILHALEPFHVTPEMGIGSGQSHSESYRLDDGWALNCWYENKGDVLINRTLGRSIKQIWVQPPKDFTGKWITYFVNGQRGYEIDYQGGQYLGEFITYHDNGVKCVVQHYTADGAEGDDTGYHPSGHVMYKGRYEEGKQVGQWIWYDDNGNVTTTREQEGVYAYSVTFSPDEKKAPHGILFCNGQSLTITFGDVVTPLGEFTGEADGGAGHWQRVEGGAIVKNRGSGVMSERTSVLGSFEHPPEGVGADWFYVVKKGVWVDPRKWPSMNW